MPHIDTSNMHFLLSTYYYPLSDPIALNENLKIYFDNPRTDDEIKLVKDAINNSLYVHAPRGYVSQSLLSRTPDDRSLQNALRKISQISPSEYEGKDLSLIETDPLLFLAKIAIIIRYQDTEIDQAQADITAQQGQGQHYFLRNEPADTKRNILIGIASIISLILSEEDINDGSYEGFTLIAATVDDLDHELYNEKLSFNVNQFMGDCFRTNKCRRYVWTESSNNILQLGYLIEKLFKDDTTAKDKILFIGKLINIINLSDDDHIHLLFLCSIFECLVVGRDAGISKQFQEKIYAIVNKMLPGKDTSGYKPFLKRLYDLRSKIAHGDSTHLTKIIRKTKKQFQQSGKDMRFYSQDWQIINHHVNISYYILSMALTCYLKDRAFINSLRPL